MKNLKNWNGYISETGRFYKTRKIGDKYAEDQMVEAFAKDILVKEAMRMLKEKGIEIDSHSSMNEVMIDQLGFVGVVVENEKVKLICSQHPDELAMPQRDTIRQIVAENNKPIEEIYPTEPVETENSVKRIRTLNA